MRNKRTSNYLIMKEETVIVRKLNGIGIDSKLNGWNLKTETMIEKKFYNGRICFNFGGMRVGLKTLMNQPKCNHVINHIYPF